MSRNGLLSISTFGRGVGRVIRSGLREAKKQERKRDRDETARKNRIVNAIRADVAEMEESVANMKQILALLVAQKVMEEAQAEIDSLKKELGR